MKTAPRGKTIYRVFETALGWCAAARNARGICGFVLPAAEPGRAEAKIQRRCRDTRPSRSAMPKLVNAVRRYFNGWRTSFDDFAVDLSSGTAFQQRVRSLTRRIPYGQVRSYGWIGLEMGRPEATRAIGGALAANPVPLLIPCHRVVQEDGFLGGFSAEGGIEMKAAMLELERIPMAGQGDVRRVIAAR